ncbi:ABC transporter substrate-binding protein [Haladaptatus pallidirubidus]|uniref:Chemotactic signal transduction system substrate-binding protein BasB n=1 Tax=Haladaptatus pallidirubidus TaxID=1008152 RepID=A0AAV3UBC4_9EURY|nr:ABC transporter substrate-binding protein [Haladaptatus pallidirubidus]
MNTDVWRIIYIRLASTLPATGALAGCLGGKLGRSPIQLGAVLPLSADGFLGTVAEHHQRAIEQAVTDVNQEGGPLGREIELTVEDTALDPKQAKDALKTLSDVGVIGFVGPVVTDIAMVLAEELPNKDIFAVSPSSTHPALATAGLSNGTKFFGRTAANDIQQALVMAKVLNSDRYVGVESVATLYVDNSFGAGLADTIESNVSGDVVASVPFPTGRETYSMEIKKIVESGADAVAFASESGNTTVLEALVESSYEGEYVLSEGLLPSEIPPHMDGMYSASVAATNTTGAIELEQKLRDIAPLAAYTQQAYDGLFLMALAMESAGEASATAISNNLVSVSGGRGQTVSVDDFERASTLIDAGRDVNYQGASSSVDLNANLEPLNAYIIEQVDGGAITELELLRSSFFEGKMEQ